MDDKESRAKHAKHAAGESAAGPAAPPADLPPASAGGEAAPQEGKAGRRRSMAIACVALACLVAVYIGGLIYFSDHFLPRTQIGSYDISGLSAGEAAAVLDGASGDYTLSVVGEGLDFEITLEGAGLRIDSLAVVQKALAQNAAWEWPYRIATAAPQDLTDAMQATFDESGFTALVSSKVAEANDGATDPVSAGIAYDAATGMFSVVPERLGTRLDEAAVVGKVEQAAFRMEDVVEIGEGELLRPPLVSDDPRLAQAAEDAGGLLGAEVDVMLSGVLLDEIDSELVASWIALDENVAPFIDEGILRGWTGALAEGTNTVGKRREYDTPRGEHVVVEGGSYGWEIDYDAFVQAVLDAVAAREKGTLEVPCTSRAAALPDGHNVDFGARYIDVNLTAQHAVFYDGAKVLWEADIVSGMPDEKHRTPYGVYEINLKESPSKLIGEMVNNKPEYETTVQYWMPFVGNSIGFHDATWQPGFGGSLYSSGYGSHGCVNLSYANAQDLYAIVTPGTPVITHA